MEAVIKRMCAIAAEVSMKRFNWKIAADCFCIDRYRFGANLPPFQLDEEIIKFIETAVIVAIEQFEESTSEPENSE